MGWRHTWGIEGESRDAALAHVLAQVVNAHLHAEIAWSLEAHDTRIPTRARLPYVDAKQFSPHVADGEHGLSQVGSDKAYAGLNQRHASGLKFGIRGQRAFARLRLWQRHHVGIARKRHGRRGNRRQCSNAPGAPQFHGP